MKDRCLNKSSPNYQNYGAVGITVSEEWINSFPKFLGDMGLRPEGTSLDRINPALGYSKDNCRWASRKTQRANRSTKTEGVCKVGNKWRVKIHVDGKHIHAGYYDTKEEAIKVRRIKEKEYWPEVY